jgi:hypothetical protein
MEKKQCFKCGEVKDLSCFYKHKHMADGCVNKCKECNKADVRKNRKKNLEYYRKYDRDRGSRLSKEYQDWYKVEYPAKTLARHMVGNAVRDGKLKKSNHCEDCGQQNHIIHGHHDDYAYPLEVRWLCPACHKAWHSKNGEAKNAR